MAFFSCYGDGLWPSEWAALLVVRSGLERPKKWLCVIAAVDRGRFF
jgi:hypothetical protein